MKKLLFLLTFALSASSTVFAEEVQINGLWYSLSEITAEVIKYKNDVKYSGSIVIPSSVSYNDIEYSVTSIGKEAFYDCADLTSVTMPNSVTSIGSYAFDWCSNLTSVTIPNSVTNVGQDAFSGCDGLTKVELNSNAIASKSYINSSLGGIFGVQVEEYIIGENVTSIGNSAFSGCTGLTSVTIPNSVTNIGNEAFSNCKSLTSITIPNSVTTIGMMAFWGCTNLTSISIPNIVTNIGSSAFSNTPWYDNQPDGLIYAGKVAYKFKGTMQENTSITIEEGTLSISDDCFSGCTGLTTITIPNSVISIGKEVFYNCRSLTSVTIPDGIKSINSYTFANCTSLNSITIPSSVTTISSSAFSNTLWYDKQADGLIYAGKVAYKFKGTMQENTSITIEEGTLSISDDCFSNCTKLVTITIPNSVTSIGESAFSGCRSLTSITIPSGVTIIESNLFENCYNLKTVNIANTVYSIGMEAFKNSGLTAITIPNGVIEIGYRAFYSCSSLSSITIPSSVTSIGYEVFKGCTNLETIMVDPGNNVYDSRNACNAIIETESNKLLYGCKNSVIPSSVTSIGSSAFYGCIGLTNIEIPNSVTSIGPSAFDGCKGLTSIEIPNSIKGIEDSTFRNCTGLTSVRIPNSVTDLVAQSFYGCESLVSLYIGNSVSYLDYNVFQDCTNLTDIYCYSKKAPTTFSWVTGTRKKDIFSNLSYENATLHVPSEAIESYKSTEPWSYFQKVVEMTAEEMAMGIHTVDSKKSVKSDYYTLDGRKHYSQQKGINIIGGKKVIGK